MAKESERKFLIDGSKMSQVIPPERRPKVHVACYWTPPPLPAVRTTYSPTTGKAKFCIKTGMGEVRDEFEESMNLTKAVEAVEAGPTKLIKLRYDVNGWEIDCFLTMPLWLAEWEVGHNMNGELLDVDMSWIVREVTNDPEYTNQALAWKYGKK